MNKKIEGLSNGYVFQNVFTDLKLLRQFANDVFQFDLSRYWLIHSEYSKVSTSECTLTLTNGEKNVLIEMKTKKSDGFDDTIIFFTKDMGPTMYQKVHKCYPTIVLGIRRYL